MRRPTRWRVELVSVQHRRGLFGHVTNASSTLSAYQGLANLMAKCDEGYLCEVCGEEVENIQESDLYLRFVIGEMDPEQLHSSRERHIACNPVLAQFIEDDRFSMNESDVPASFGLTELDESYVAERRELVTRGYRRLHELASSEQELAIHEYPLPEAIEKWR